MGLLVLLTWVVHGDILFCVYIFFVRVCMCLGGEVGVCVGGEGGGKICIPCSNSSMSEF